MSELGMSKMEEMEIMDTNMTEVQKNISDKYQQD